MNLQQFISASKMFNAEQLLSLHRILTFQQGIAAKLKLKDIVYNKTYSVFDGQYFTKQFQVHDTYIEFKPIQPAKAKEELKKIRNILLTGEVK